MQRLIPPLEAFLISMLWSTPSFAQTYRDHDAWSHSGWGWDHMIFGGLMMIAFWGGIIVLIVLLVRWLGAGSLSSQVSTPPRQTPLEILQRRFAKGEIDQSEYEQCRKLLSE